VNVKDGMGWTETARDLNRADSLEGAPRFSTGGKLTGAEWPQ